MQVRFSFIRWLRKYGPIAVLMILITSLGCSRPEAAKAGEAVARFRKDVREGKYLEAHQSGTRDFASKIPEQRLVRLMEKVRDQLGELESSEPNGARYAWKRDTGREWVLGFKSKYKRGEAREHFLVRREDGVWKIAAYHIGSDQLTGPAP